MAEWVCSQCNADVDDGFDICWQCGATIDGKQNDDFVREVDVATLPADHVRTIQCDDCGYRGRILTGRYQYKGWMYLIIPVLVLSMFGLIPLFIWLRFTEFLRFKLCPQCRNGNSIHDWYGDITPENEELWTNTQNNEVDQFKQSRFRILCLILGTLLIPAAIMLVAWLSNR